MTKTAKRGKPAPRNGKPTTKSDFVSHKLPWCKVPTADILKISRTLSDRSRLAFLTLALEFSDRLGQIPEGMELRILSGVASRSAWVVVWKEIKSHFAQRDGRWEIECLTQITNDAFERVAAWQFAPKITTAACSDFVQAGHEKIVADQRPGSLDIEQEEEELELSSKSEPHSESLVGRARKTARTPRPKTRMTDDWEPDDETCIAIENIGIDLLDLKPHIVEFRVHWMSVPGQAGMKSNWGKTLINRIANLIAWGKLKTRATKEREAKKGGSLAARQEKNPRGWYG